MNYEETELRKERLLLLKKVIGTISLLVSIICFGVWIVDINFLFIDFNKPLLFAFFNYSLKAILIPVYYIKENIKSKCNKRKLQEGKTTYEFDLDLWKNDELSEALEKLNPEKSFEYNDNFCKIKFILFCLYFLPSALFIFGISLTNYRSQFICANLGFLFVLIQKMTCEKSRPTLLKFLLIPVLYVGVGIFSVSIETNGPDNFFGDLIIITSSFIFSIYLNKVKGLSKSYPYSFDITLVLGYIGLYVLLFVPFLIMLLTLFKIEVFSIPNHEDVKTIIISAGFSCINDILVSFNVIFLSAYIVAIGINLSYPLVKTYRILFKGENFDLYYLFGIILMLTAFFILLIDKYRGCKHKHRNSAALN